MAITETQQKLEQWGRWQCGGAGLGYGNVLGKLRGGGLPPAAISDDYALRIERVVAVLKQTSLEQYRCIRMSYAQRMSNKSIARELGISHHTVQQRIKAAEHWLDLAFDVENI